MKKLVLILTISSLFSCGGDETPTTSQEKIAQHQSPGKEVTESDSDETELAEEDSLASETPELVDREVEIPDVMYLLTGGEYIHHYCEAETPAIHVHLDMGEIWRLLGQDTETYYIKSHNAKDLPEKGTVKEYWFETENDFGEPVVLVATHHFSNGRVDWVGFTSDSSSLVYLDTNYRNTVEEYVEECDFEEYE